MLVDTQNPGTVTSIATGEGISGGTITGSGTITLDNAAATTIGGISVRFASGTGTLFITNNGNDA